MSTGALRNFCFTEARVYKIEHYSWIPADYMDDSRIVTKKNKVFWFNLTGFLVHMNDIYIIFPKNHKIPDDDDELLNHIQTLAGVLIRYSSDGSVELKENDLLGKSIGNVSKGIKAALWIIKDYIEYGYFRKQIQRKAHSGNHIDWPRTIKLTEPIITLSGLVYTEPVYRKNSVDYNNMIYFLHKYVVQNSFYKFGWLLGYNSYEFDPSFVELPCDIEMGVYLLNKELDSTFNEREAKLLQTMIEYIQGTDLTEKRDTLDTMATNYFHNVWEAMCDYVLKNQYQIIKQFIPKPTWHLQNGQLETTHQRPDILLAENKSIYVIDAKYYNVPKSLPGWHDLVKQFYYVYSLEHKFTNMCNALILPDTVPEKISYFGFVDMEGRPDLGKIEAFLFDTYALMNDYANYKQGDWRVKLINEFSK
ncbi:LlaJI family restriction endonuclease [Paenibacillus aquistagni]|uniref:LlaJI family restriction endonuclease n=1 Tax=Paenibacillus aquistagni TaxID=1852522 RepID=UPI00145AFD89|nr:LlaJI family restriction endonuclease [Paenibacillus aquistagni]NMM53418.1 LlaJI family restriction endonuclease [Paenibacillus aquistagni]